MNVAPYVLCREKHWKLKDDRLIRTADDLFEQTDLTWIPRDLISVVFSRELTPREQRLGLLAIPAEELAHLLNSARPTRGRYEPTPTLTRLTPIDEADLCLAFPDDDSPEPNFSVFAPSIDSSGKIVLNILRFDSHPVPHGRIAESGGCTLAIDGDLPNRIFSCVSTGCAEPCHAPEQYEHGLTKTIRCRC